MTHLLRRAGIATIATIATFCLAIPAANAAVTSSNATTAAPFGFRDLGGPPTTRYITATTTGGTTGDQVDIDCYRGTNRTILLAGVSVTANQVAADIPESALDAFACRLAVVPAGVNPSDLTPFTGPIIGGGDITVSKISGGANDQVPYDFSIAQAQEKGFVDYNSLGDCGLCDMALVSPTAVKGPELFFDNARLDSSTHNNGSGGMRPGILVDGKTAYASWNADQKNATGPGVPPITLTHSVDPASGDMTYEEDQNLVACSPSDVTCTSFVPTMLRYQRMVIQDHDGRSVRIIDTIRNTDSGASHDFDFDFEEFQDSGNNGYRFPGESAYAHHVGGDSITTGFRPISTIGLIYDTGFSPGVDNPLGTLTVSPQPTRALFNTPDEFWLNFTGTIAPGGSQTINQTFSMGETQAEVDDYVHQAEFAQDAQGLPSVAITAPADGTSVTATPVTVTGTASDNGGVTSLKVNGADVSVAADGTWSASVPLTEGANTITAIAKDAPGNEATATRSITYTRPAPPPPPVPPVVTITKNGKVKVTRKGNKIVVDTGITVGCPAGTTACTAATDLRTFKAVAAKLKKTKLTLATKKFTIVAGHTQKIVLTLSAKGAKALKRNKKLKVVVAVIGRVGSGPATTATRTITIKQPKAKRKKH
jgi:hypothetical protein